MKAKKIKNKKSNDPEVLVYCKACLSIRNGTHLSEENLLLIPAERQKKRLMN